jgi:hypothetical protein
LRSAVLGRLAIASLVAAPAVAVATHWGVLSSRGVAPPRAAPPARPAASGAVIDCGATGVVCGAEHAHPACVEGRCALGCEAGFADCNAFPGDGCEVELASDARHCGRCDHGCAGAACEHGRCVARLLGRGAAIAADDDAVYAHRGGVVKMFFDGGDDAALTQEDPRDPASAMAVDATHVYWSLPKRRAVFSVPRMGGNVNVVAEGVSAAAIAVAGGMVYWLEADAGGWSFVKRVPVDGGPIAAVAHLAPGTPQLLAARRADVCYAAGGGVFRLPAGAPHPEPLLPSIASTMRGPPDALAGDGEAVYWAGRGPGDAAAIVLRSGPGDPTPARIAAHPLRIRALAVNRTHVFWSDERERVFMAPKRPL